MSPPLPSAGSSYWPIHQNGDMVSGMARTVDLTIDSQKRMSVGKLGLPEGHAVATELPDGGWVVRAARLYTDAEIEILADPANREAIERGLADAEAGRTVEAFRR